MRAKLLKIINGGSRGYQVRVFKTGIFSKAALRIYSAPLLVRAWAPYLAPDRLSHFLSIAFLSLPENFRYAVRHILLVPELVRSQRYLLSHIYLAEAQALAFYLSPPSLLPSRSLNFQDFTNTANAQNRMGKSTAGLRLLGLWGHAFERAIDSWARASKQMHKFFLPLPFVGLRKRSCLPSKKSMSSMPLLLTLMLAFFFRKKGEPSLFALL